MKTSLTGYSAKEVMALEGLVKLLKKLEIKGTAKLEVAIQQHAMIEAMRKMMAELEEQVYKTTQMAAALGPQQYTGLSAQLNEQLGNSINADILAKLGRV